MNNPFIVTGKIPPEYFCDRKEESRRIIAGMAGGDNICLLSPRRLGKSKLVRYCYDIPEISQKYYTFYIDILHRKVCRNSRSVSDRLFLLSCVPRAGRCWTLLSAD